MGGSKMAPTSLEVTVFTKSFQLHQMRKSVQIKILRHHHIKNMKSTSAPGEHLQKAIKNQSKIVSRPILRPESNRVIRLSVSSTVLPQ